MVTVPSVLYYYNKWIIAIVVQVHNWYSLSHWKTTCSLPCCRPARSRGFVSDQQKQQCPRWTVSPCSLIPRPSLPGNETEVYKYRLVPKLHCLGMRLKSTNIVSFPDHHCLGMRLKSTNMVSFPDLHCLGMRLKSTNIVSFPDHHCLGMRLKSTNIVSFPDLHCLGMRLKSTNIDLFPVLILLTLQGW